MPRQTTYLLKRGDLWYFRARLPQKIHRLVNSPALQLPPSLAKYRGKVQIVAALGTRDRREAERLVHEKAAELNRDLRALQAFAAQPARLAELAGLNDWRKSGQWKNPADVVNAARHTRARIEQHQQDQETAERDFDAALDAYLEPSTLDMDLRPIVPRPKPPEGNYGPAVALARKVVKGEAGMLLSEALAAHLAEIGERARQQTVKARRRRVDKLMKWLGGDQEVAAVDRATAGRYVTHVAQQAGAVKTKKDTISDLSTFFQWCYDRGACDSNVFHRMGGSIRETSRGVKKSSDRREWSHDELRDLLSAIKREKGADSALWKMTVIGALTGMRENEIAETKVADVHAQHIHVPEGKTEAAIRDVPLHPLLKPLVKKWAKESTDGYLVSGLRRGGEDNKRHHHFAKQFSRFIRKHVTEDKNLVFHSLRHSVSTELRWRGVDLALIHAITGHADEDFTDRHYVGKPKIKLLADAMAKLNYGAAVAKLVKGA